MSGIYYDEHEKFQIDLRKTIWSTDGLHNLYKTTIGNELSDVDWICETESTIYLIEFKTPTFTWDDSLCKCNGCDCNACKTESRICEKCGKAVAKKAVKKDNYLEFLDKSRKKYYGSIYYLFAMGKSKPIKYYCVVNHSIADRTWRKKATASIKTRLPFNLQKVEGISAGLIDDFKVLSIREWNELHPFFPLKPLNEMEKNL